MPATLRDRFPGIISELRPKVGAAVKVAAEVIAEDAAVGVPDRSPLGQGLIESIEVKREDVAEYSVNAGGGEFFYGYFIEYGTERAAAQPFLIPAAEAHTTDAAALVTAALRGL